MNGTRTKQERTVNAAAVVRAMITVAVAVFVLGGCAGVAYRAEGQFTDREITAAVEESIRMSEAVPLSLIDVETEDGVVTLTGSVGHILARDQALRITRSVRGVRSIIDRIEIEPVHRDDATLVKNVGVALAEDPATESYEIGVEVNEGVVTLTGEVESWAEKRLALEVVKGVAGVRDVIADIDVEYATERPDEEIRGEVVRRLELDPILYDDSLIVEVDGGAVELHGVVWSLGEKVRAMRLSRIAGVESVDGDDLHVKWRDHSRFMRADTVDWKSDEEIRAAVGDALMHDPRVFSFDIDVEVEEGEVTLSGVVDNLKAKRAAARDAENTIGVGEVVNGIKVRPTVRPGNTALAEKVEEALSRDAIVERHDITVAARNRKIYLYGYVDSYFEWHRVQEIVSRVPGVASIENRIDVLDGWEGRSDAELERRIREELSWSPLVELSEIGVGVEDGVVTLSGEVGSWREFDSVLQNSFEGGARAVRCRLTIDNSPERERLYRSIDYYERYFE